MQDTWILYRRYIIAGVTLIGVTLVLSWTWWAVKTKPAPTITQTYTPVPSIVSAYKTHRVQVRNVQVIDKSDLKYLKLPDQLIANSVTQVLAQGRVQDSDGEGATDVAAFINVSTGTTQLIQKKSPPPFVRFMKKTEVGVSFGVDQNLDRKVGVFVQMKILGVGKVEIGLRGELKQSLSHANNKPMEGYVGVQASMPIDW